MTGERVLQVKRKKSTILTALAILVTALLATGVLSLTIPRSSSAKNLPPPQTRNFDLYVRDNFLNTPDGKKIWVFGYTSDPKGKAQIPGPSIIVNQGDTLNITLHDDQDPTDTKLNPGGDGHTIHLHGMDVPSQYDGDPMTAPGGHGVMEHTAYTYHVVANDAGTYWYHCHVEAAEHIQMGMYGAIIIRPRGEPNRAYAGTPAFDKEYTFVLSDMDSTAHDEDYNALYRGKPGDNGFNWTQYVPNYFFINGKSWPDTMNDPNDNITATIGQTVLVRLINAGYVDHSMHSHGYHFTVIGTDGRALAQPYEKDTLDIAPGETYEILFHFNQVGRFMFHDHYEQNTTNNGAYPGGMMTMISVNNPNGSNPIPVPGATMAPAPNITPVPTHKDPDQNY